VDKKIIFTIIIMPFGYPVLTPAYGLGSYSRTGPSLLISSPRTKNGSQGRIYAYMKNRGQGPQYINFLINVLGPRPTGLSPWTGI
jgi:hypothetical protein